MLDPVLTSFQIMVYRAALDDGNQKDQLSDDDELFVRETHLE